MKAITATVMVVALIFFTTSLALADGVASITRRGHSSDDVQFQRKVPGNLQGSNTFPGKSRKCISLHTGHSSCDIEPHHLPGRVSVA